MVVHCLDGRKLIYGMQFERIAMAVASSFELLGSLFFFFAFVKASIVLLPWLYPFASIGHTSVTLLLEKLLILPPVRYVGVYNISKLILMYANLKELLWLLPLCANEGVCLFAFVKTSIVLCFSVPIRFK